MPRLIALAARPGMEEAVLTTEGNPAPAPTGGHSGPRPGGGPRRGKREGYRGKYTPRRKVCAFCAEKVQRIDYKDVARLRRFLSDRGKIDPRRKTGTCASHQRRLSIALKRARHLALLPFTAEHIRITGGVGLRA